VSITRKLILLLFVAAGLSVISCTNRAAKLDDYGAVPHFTLIDSEGHPFDSNELKGKVWIVDFIYTNCPGPCPRMTSQMHTLSEKLKADKNIRLVSISVDPERDTPPVLNAYARRFGGPTPQWTFLTGPLSTIDLLAVNTFHIGTVRNRLNHSTRFMLVDKNGHIRAYESTFDPGGMDKLQADAEALE
jgi:protein SCO1/2